MSKRDIQVDGVVVDGEFAPGNNWNWKTALKIFDGADVTMTIGPRKKKRTIPQNSYLFGGPYKMISDFTGQDKESVHAFFKDKFLKSYDKGPIPTVRSTTSLSTKEFIKYYRDIIQFAAEFLGLYIPEPNEDEMWQAMLEQAEKEGK